MASSHVPRETSLNLILPSASTLRRGYLGAESCAVNREYVWSFQADGSHEHNLRGAGLLRHIVTPNGRRAPYIAAPSGRAHGVAAGGSSVTAPHGARTSKNGTTSTHAIEAGRPSSPSPGGNSPSASANTDPPADMSLPTLGRQSARRHLRNWRNAHLAAGAQRQVRHVMHHRESIERVGRGDASSLQPRTDPDLPGLRTKATDPWQARPDHQPGRSTVPTRTRP